MGLLVSVIATNLLALLALLSQARLLSQASAGIAFTQESARANDARIQLIGQLHLIAFIATGIVFLFWFHSAYSNLILVGTRRSSLSANSATGNWFIPFLNLVRPHTNTAELWNRGATNNAEPDVSSHQAPRPVTLWWLAFIISNIIGRAAGVIFKNAHGLPALTSMTYWYISFNLAQAFAGVLAIRVVSAINQQQVIFDDVVAQVDVSVSPAGGVA